MFETILNMNQWAKLYVELQVPIVQSYIFNKIHLRTEKPSYYWGVTYSITWQIRPLCHNNEKLHESTHYIFCHVQKINILLNVFTNMLFLSWYLCGLEEGIHSLLMMPLQISNKYLIELLWYGMHFHHISMSKF